MSISPFFLCLLAFLGILSGTGKAAVIFSGLTITPTSFSVTISGTLPDFGPKNDWSALFLVNPDSSSSPGYALSDFQRVETQDFSGTQSLLPYYPFGTGGVIWGDYAVVNFSQNLSTGETLSGTLSGTWSSPVFDPSRISSLNIFWGSDISLGYSGAITGGVLLGANVPVNAVTAPEPGSALYAALVSLLALGRRSRRLV